MRRQNHGVFSMNIALSISHDLATGRTFAMLLGTSEEQTWWILDQLSDLPMLASHPLFLPTMLSKYTLSHVAYRVRLLHDALKDFEMQSKRTRFMNVTLADCDPTEELKKHDELRKDVLQIIQLATAWEDMLRTCSSMTEGIRQANKRIKFGTARQRRKVVKEVGAILDERSQFTRDETQNLVSQLQFVKERTQAQMNAIHHIIA
ncbi:hypothetical protein BDY21DRAFT_26476 [Lineolata rhizophorae]|uniref:Uncharacterized protein n=1 Tax=Lineolata rhizophorae TaxID=578093 RepID=A0A6A6P0H8_9PEZI|nr:hypothetical protein BDY21DRAFT_26476 [Lineolata rhizophorae]